MSKGSWSTQRSKKRRLRCCSQKVKITNVAAVLILLLILATISVMLYLINKNTVAGHKGETRPFVTASPNPDVCAQPLCKTTLCTATAERFLDNMNSSVEACENFYQFACSGNKERAMSVLDELDARADGQLTRVLDEMRVRVETQVSPYRQLTQLYTACVTHTQEESVGSGLSDAHILFREAGGWPLLDNSSQDSWSPQTLVLLKDLGLESNSLLNISVDTSSGNITYVVARPEMLLPTATLLLGLAEPQVGRYLEYIREVMRLYGVTSPALEHAKDLLELEISLAVILEGRRNVNFTSQYTLTQLQSLPSMSWLPWAQLLNHSSSTVLNSTVILVQDPEYIGKLYEFLQQKHDGRIADYVMWRAAESLSVLVSHDLLTLHQTYRGLTVTTFCRDLLSSEMNVALSALYLHNIFDKRSKPAAEAVVENVREGIIKNIEASLGMDEESKRHTVESVRGVSARVAYPTQLQDVLLLQQYHRHLTLNSSSSFLRMALALAEWRRSKDTVPSDWWRNCDVTRAQATFSVQDKSVTVNAALLQPPLFNPDLPAYVNYGALGYLVAHHLTHASHLQGKKLNKPEAHIEYKGGLSHLFRAYKSERVEEAGLPDLCHYNSQQLLLISLANMLCTSRRTGSKMELRVNTVMNESNEFHQAFNCSGL